VGQVTDAAILAGITDGVILVLASGQTRIEWRSELLNPLRV